ncbi:PilZ domain-containing protein [Reinekea forsetii]|nr:PilZ domain-containing protein [Reinekea forsetii]
MPDVSNDKRDSFRVDMNAVVQLKPVDEDTVNGSDCFPELITLSMMMEANHIDTEINALSERIKDLSVQKTLKLMQMKIDLTLKAQEIEKVQNFGLKPQPLNIGEGGCSFASNANVNIGDRVALAIVQSSHFFTFFPIAHVVEITPSDATPQLHLAFEKLTESDNTVLMQQLFKIQTSQPRSES